MLLSNFKLLLWAGLLVLPTIGYGQVEQASARIGQGQDWRESDPVVSADHSTLYFSRYNHPRNQGTKNAADIWLRPRLADGTWGSALNAGSPINTFGADRVIGLSADGRRMAVLREGATTYLDILVQGNRTWRIADTWPLTGGLGKHLVASFDLEASKLVFVQEVDGQQDLFEKRALAGGQWSAEKPLWKLNTAEAESSPYLAQDGMSLYFRRAGRWMMCRYSTSEETYTDIVDISDYLPFDVQQLSCSVTDPEQSVGVLIEPSGTPYLSEYLLPREAQPIPSRLLEGELDVMQSPTDRINGASVRLMVDGRERDLYPNAAGKYVLVVPAEGYARISAEAPGFFAPARALNAAPGLDGNIASGSENQFSADYYEREHTIRKLYADISTTQQEMQALQSERTRLSQQLRAEQIAAGKALLEGFTDPELDKLRDRLQTAQQNLTDTIPDGMQPKGGFIPDNMEQSPAAERSDAFAELEAMKARFRAQQEDQLGDDFRWRTEDPGELRKAFEETITETVIPSISHDLVTDAYREQGVDSTNMELEIRNGFFENRAPKVYERQNWELALIDDLRPAAQERLAPTIRNGMEEDARLEAAFNQQQNRLGRLQDSLQYALNAQVAEEGRMRGEEKQFAIRGVAPPAVPYGASSGNNLMMVPLEPGQKMVLEQIQFLPNAVDFTNASYGELDRLVNLLTENPNLRVEIGAHTNHQLGYLAAHELSEGRAWAVANYLLRNGIDAKRVSAVGYGRERPLVSFNDGARDERIELTIL